MPLSKRSYNTKRLRFYFEAGKLFYLAYAVKMFFFLLFKKVDILWANDMDTLLPNFLVAKLRGKKLVYDSHEYWTEVPELIARPKIRAIWLWLEKRLFPKVDIAITVNQSIAEIYSQKYGIDVEVIRNLPISRDAIKSNYQNQQRLIYQGALNIGRGIELMMDSLEFLPEYSLEIAGYGSHEQEIRAHATRLQWSSRIHFKGFLQPNELKNLTANSSLGLSLEEDLGGSYHLALPNKLFDYVQAGIPILVSDLPEMRTVTEKYGLGEVLLADERIPKALANKIKSICENTLLYNELASNCREAASLLNWESEQKKLEKVCSQLA